MEEVEIGYFIRLIEDEGCIPSHRIVENGIVVQYYLSFNQATKVPIYLGEDMMSARTAAALLIRLELEDIIERIGLIF